MYDDLRSKPLHVDLPDVAAVDSYGALGGLVEPQEQTHAGGLAASGRPHNGNGLPRAHSKIETVRVFFGTVDLHGDVQRYHKGYK